MDLTVILRNIEARLVFLGISADEAGRRAGRPDAIRNIRRKIRGNAPGSMRADTLAALATALKTTPEDLMRDEVVHPVPGLREILLDQRALIDRQLAALDAAEFTGQKRQQRKNR